MELVHSLTYKQLVPLQENIDRNWSAHHGKYHSCKTCGRQAVSNPPDT